MMIVILYPVVYPACVIIIYIIISEMNITRKRAFDVIGEYVV